ncbi:hypothetical protein TNCV_1234021 [Trichonephila clavipes]|nr:hypothetical protein TNCV_1234021 [Trichonephila clavipes]
MGTSASKICHLQEDRAQIALDRPVVLGTTISWCEGYGVPLPAIHGHPCIDPWRHQPMSMTSCLQRLQFFQNNARPQARISQDCLRTVTTLPWQPYRSPIFVYNQACVWDH